MRGFWIRVSISRDGMSVLHVAISVRMEERSEGSANISAIAQNDAAMIVPVDLVLLSA
jgi:hypothetical protein